MARFDRNHWHQRSEIPTLGVDNHFSQIKAIIAVNTALIEFYWDLGRMLSEMIKQSNRGDKVLESVSRDLRLEFPDMKGFSVTNLKYTKLFYEYFTFRPQVEDEIRIPLTKSSKMTDLFLKKEL